ncbi:RNA polymerase sigma factor [Streptomyces sp. NPDC056817]|uniref:RNA polymerase sigma factor n=1 Tax=Streptomyces sp. NPDC056817 TaxID=3345950 RepID=UPI0036BD0F39
MRTRLPAPLKSLPACAHSPTSSAQTHKAVHRAKQHIRRASVTGRVARTLKRRRTGPSGDAAVLDRADPDASDAVVRRDEVDRLLAGLTPRQRVAVVLRYLLDQDDQEIAQALGCSSATVRSHLSQARAALRLSAHTLTERS